MSREKRLPSGLTHREEQFAQLMCKGMRPKDAFLLAGYCERTPIDGRAEQANKECYRKAEQPHIARYMAEWLGRARISDIDSPGAAVSDVVRAFHKAVDMDNLTAAAALGRLRFQANGIAERTVLNLEATISDADLLRRLAGGDDGKVALLSNMLKPATFSHGEKQPLLIEGQAADEDD